LPAVRCSVRSLVVGDFRFSDLLSLPGLLLREEQ
jgi:hypothetical protein